MATKSVFKMKPELDNKEFYSITINKGFLNYHCAYFFCEQKIICLHRDVYSL